MTDFQFASRLSLVPDDASDVGGFGRIPLAPGEYPPPEGDKFVRVSCGTAPNPPGPDAYHKDLTLDAWGGYTLSGYNSGRSSFTPSGSPVYIDGQYAAYATEFIVRIELPDDIRTSFAVYVRVQSTGAVIPEPYGGGFGYCALEQWEGEPTRVFCKFHVHSTDYPCEIFATIHFVPEPSTDGFWVDFRNTYEEL